MVTLTSQSECTIIPHFVFVWIGVTNVAMNAKLRKFTVSDSLDENENIQHSNRDADMKNIVERKPIKPINTFYLNLNKNYLYSCKQY